MNKIMHLYALSGHGMNFGLGMIGRIGGMIMMSLLLIAFIVFAIVWMSKNSNQRNTINGSQQPPSTDRSMEILNERYAMGEITDEEYAKKKVELKKSGL